MRDGAEIAERGREAARPALAPEERDSLLVQRGGAVEILLGDGHAAQLGDRAGDSFLVAEFPVEIEAFLQPRRRHRVVPLPERKDGAVHEGERA